MYETADSPKRAVCEADRNHSLCGIRSLTVRSPKGKFQAPRRGDDFEANAERGGGSFFASFLSLHQRKKRRSGMTNPHSRRNQGFNVQWPPGPYKKENKGNFFHIPRRSLKTASKMPNLLHTKDKSAKIRNPVYVTPAHFAESAARRAQRTPWWRRPERLSERSELRGGQRPLHVLCRMEHLGGRPFFRLFLRAGPGRNGHRA